MKKINFSSFAYCFGFFIIPFIYGIEFFLVQCFGVSVVIIPITLLLQLIILPIIIYYFTE